jgi:hypothetical protein
MSYGATESIRERVSRLNPKFAVSEFRIHDTNCAPPSFSAGQPA